MFYENKTIQVKNFLFLDTNIADVSKNDNNSVTISCGTEVDKNCLVSYYTANSIQNRILPPGHAQTITVGQEAEFFEIDTSKNSTQYLWRFICKGKNHSCV